MTEEKQRSTDLSTDFQGHILAMALRVPGFMARVRPVMNPDYFKDELISDMVAWSNQHWDENKEVPSKQALLDCFPAETERAVIKALYKQELTDPKHTIHRITQYARQSATRLAILKGGQVLSAEMNGEKYKNPVTNKPEDVDLVKLIRDAIMVGSDHTNIGEEFHTTFDADVAEILNPKPTERLQTGLNHLDEAGLNIERGELGCVLGPSKRGKSHVLINIAYGAMKAGLNVIYYTLEMSSAKVRRRMHLRIAGVKADIKQDPKAFVDTLKERTAKLVKGKLMVKRYHSKEATVETLRAHLTQAIAEGFKPDVVIVDYAGILRPVKPTGELRHDLGEIFVQLRAIAGEYNVGVWTGAQANRGAVNKEQVNEADLAECYEIMFHLDAGFSISMTDEEKERGEGRFVVFAARNEAGGTVITFNHDYSRSIIQTTGVQHSVAQKKRRDRDTGGTGPAAAAEAQIGAAKLRKHQQEQRENV